MMFLCLFSSDKKIFLEFQIIKATDDEKQVVKVFFFHLLESTECVFVRAERNQKPIGSELGLEHLKNFKLLSKIKEASSLFQENSEISPKIFEAMFSSFSRVRINTNSKFSFLLSALFISRPKFCFPSPHSRQSRKNFYRTWSVSKTSRSSCDLNGNRATELFSFLFVVIFS